MKVDEYDVRAVEARLAAMAAKRQQRTSGQTMQVATWEHARLNGRPSMVVGDFELSAADSSASESEDDGDASTSSDEALTWYTAGKNKCVAQKKARLKDSLDLSMSASIAFAVDTMPSVKQPQKRPSDQCGGDNKPTTESIHVTKATSSAMDLIPIKCGDIAENPFTGTLVQRRRELEKRLERQNETVSPASQRLLPERQVRPSPSPLHVTVHAHAIPTVAVSRIPKPIGEHTSATALHLEQSSSAPGRTSAGEKHEAKLSHIAQPHSQASRSQFENHIRSRAPNVTQVNEVSRGPAPGFQPSAVLAKTQLAVATEKNQARLSFIGAPVAIVGAAAPPPMPQVAPSARIQPISVAETAQKAKKTAIATTIREGGGSVAATATLGYARSTPASNQTTTAPSHQDIDATNLTKLSEPQDCADDLIDDLLSAEELRLRESLDKLSNRLSSLTSARAALPRNPKFTSNQLAASEPLRKADESKTLRAASYGGGAHARLHQQSSPTTRNSHAKRVELSGGVHKARVRTGGATTQETATTTRVDADGKHKIVVKRDLAHLLF